MTSWVRSILRPAPSACRSPRVPRKPDYAETGEVPTKGLRSATASWKSHTGTHGRRRSRWWRWSGQEGVPADRRGRGHLPMAHSPQAELQPRQRLDPLTFAVEDATAPGTTLVVRTCHAHPQNWLGLPTKPVIPADVTHAIRTARSQGWTPAASGSAFLLELASATTAGDDVTSAGRPSA
jgi:hypothetical protein